MRTRQRNPYLNRSMVRSVETFFGRLRELERTMARLGDATPQSVSVVGERRVGKSSFLWHLAQPEIAARYLDEPSSYLFVYIDFQGQRHLDLAGFSHLFSRHLAEAAAPRVKIDPAEDLTQLEAQAQTLGAAGLRVVGLFDEFETVTDSPAFGAEFFGFLRSLANSYPVAFVTASRRDLPDLCRTQEISQSPFFNIFSRVALGPLDAADAVRLVTEPSAAAGVPLEGYAEAIGALGGCLPMFLQMACSAAFECLIETGGFDEALVLQRFREEADAHLDYLWEHLEEDERAVLNHVVDGGVPTLEQHDTVRRLLACGTLRRVAGQVCPFSTALGPLLAEGGRIEAHPCFVASPSVDPDAGAPPPAAVAGIDSQVLRLPPIPEGTDPFPGIIGASRELRRLFTFIQRAAASDVSVLLLGETGTGKELVSRTIHEHSERRHGPFVVVNCGAIAEQVQESELFGHCRGAFTDAVADREGLFEAANGGTVLLDEIAEMAPSTQVRLLRVLQEREVRRVGESAPRRVDVRVMGATNRDLEAEVAAGRFREDLYYRLCVLVARLPPLRCRQEDIPLLVRHLLGARVVTRPAMALLGAHDWPGNVRELENQLAAASAMAGDGPIRPEHLWPRLQRLRPASPQGARSPGEAAVQEVTDPGQTAEPDSGGDRHWEGMSLRQARDTFERELLTARLREFGGDLERVSESLSVSRSRLYELVRKYGLRPG